MDAPRSRAHLELVVKLVALAESTQFAGERDVAFQKAWRLARREGIYTVTHNGRRYFFDPPPTVSRAGVRLLRPRPRSPRS